MKRGLFAAPVSLFLVSACVAPIATRSTPDHTTHVEVENATSQELAVSIEMVSGGAGQVSYDGRLRPGEVESLYVRNGADYLFSVTDAESGDVLATREYPVWAYTNLVFDGVELVVSDRTVEVPPSERVLPEPKRALAPLYVGGLSAGVALAPGSTQGAARLEEDKSIGLVVGLSGETRFFSDHLALNGNIGYGPGENFHTVFLSMGPMVKFRPNERVDPYVLFNVGLGGFLPRGDQEFADGSEADVQSFGSLTLDFGGGLLLGATENFFLDIQGRVHRVSLEPLFMEETADFRKEALFEEDAALFPEFRIGVRYAGL